jgi:hypothetical protein
VQSLKALEASVRQDARHLQNERQVTEGPLLGDWRRVQFLLDARKVKLLSELQAIYPIHPLDNSSSSGQHAATGGWCIRNLELPRDLAGMDDEHVSSALGYVVHLAALLSKYLQVKHLY